jgi:hypothetical protein
VSALDQAEIDLLQVDPSLIRGSRTWGVTYTVREPAVTRNAEHAVFVSGTLSKEVERGTKIARTSCLDPYSSRSCPLV